MGIATSKGRNRIGVPDKMILKPNTQIKTLAKLCTPSEEERLIALLEGIENRERSRSPINPVKCSVAIRRLVRQDKL